MNKRPAWMVISPLWSTLTLWPFWGHLCAWPVFHGTLPRIWSLGPYCPQMILTCTWVSLISFCPLKGSFEKEPGAQRQPLTSENIKSKILSLYRGLTFPSGRGFSHIWMIWLNARLRRHGPWCLSVPTGAGVGGVPAPKGAHLLRGSRGPSTVILMALW